MFSQSPEWSLDPRLAHDTVSLGDLPLCRVLLVKDANYPWTMLVPRRLDVVEIIDLDEVAQAQMMTEISRTARAVKAVTQCDKLNIAALGNAVPQLHVHVVARREGDPAWPRPVWGAVPPLAPDAAEFEQLAGALREKIWII
jgi:diadenosine tetraphosphate (Ap4A) HIT family hydrolase